MDEYPGEHQAQEAKEGACWIGGEGTGDLQPNGVGKRRCHAASGARMPMALEITTGFQTQLLMRPKPPSVWLHRKGRAYKPKTPDDDAYLEDLVKEPWGNHRSTRARMLKKPQSLPCR